VKSYLQRLAARAEGVNTTPSLIPTLRNEAIAQSDATSAFTEGDATLGQPAIRRSPRDAVTAIESPEPAQYVPALPSTRRARQDTLRAGRHEIIEETVIAENTSLQPKISNKDVRSPPVSLPSNTKSDEPAVHGSFTSPNHPSRLLIPRDLNLDPNRITTSATKASDEPANDEEKAPVIARMEPVAPLEPRLMEAPPAPVLVSDEPRLVIGQMRVEVVASAPPKTREAVRIVSRTDGASNRSRVTGPIAKLRFGLGQM
jgi:hypothetical protein